jgi:hypothetical protein
LKTLERPAPPNGTRGTASAPRNPRRRRSRTQGGTGRLVGSHPAAHGVPTPPRGVGMLEWKASRPRPEVGREGGWVRPLTEDGDVEANPGPEGGSVGWPKRI